MSLGFTVRTPASMYSLIIDLHVSMSDLFPEIRVGAVTFKRFRENRRILSFIVLVRSAWESLRANERAAIALKNGVAQVTGTCTLWRSLLHVSPCAED